MPPDKTLQKRKNRYVIIVFVSYIAFLSLLASIAFLFQLFKPAFDSYSLSTKNILSVIIAPFANGVIDFETSAVHIVFYLVLFYFILVMDDSLINRKYLRLFFCAGPLIGGVMGSCCYEIELFISHAIYGGAGSSIIAASMTAIMLVLSIISFLDTRSQNVLFSSFSLVLAAALTFVFYGDFLKAGNTTAHSWGFIAGLLIAFVFFGHNRSVALTEPV